ncbi:hypothetical protein SDC9_175199 [bioreactor metagenome]|uniref:Uncharacterized protein n=1 Tax=bioreactor metagenome TaxID=1076179 RepID=A0A645GM20_9ZZZZ
MFCLTSTTFPNADISLASFSFNGNEVYPGNEASKYSSSGFSPMFSIILALTGAPLVITVKVFCIPG